MIRILVAEDHAVVRAGIRQFLENSSRNLDVVDVASAGEMLAQLELTPWDLLLLDLQLPDRSGLEMLGELKRRFPKTRVLVISGLPERQYAVDVLRAGAAGYVSKASAPAELVGAVQKVLAGQRYVSTELADQMAHDVSRPAAAVGSRFDQLSSREIQVFVRLAGGTTITKVANELQLSVKTVSTYRARIMEKMGFSSNAEITSYALRHNIDWNNPPAPPRADKRAAPAAPP